MLVEGTAVYHLKKKILFLPQELRDEIVFN